jgi:hypothetical protein
MQVVVMPTFTDELDTMSELDEHDECHPDLSDSDKEIDYPDTESDEERLADDKEDGFDYDSEDEIPASIIDIAELEKALAADELKKSTSPQKLYSSQSPLFTPKNPGEAKERIAKLQRERDAEKKKNALLEVQSAGQKRKLSDEDKSQVNEADRRRQKRF